MSTDTPKTPPAVAGWYLVTWNDCDWPDPTYFDGDNLVMRLVDEAAFWYRLPKAMSMVDIWGPSVADIAAKAAKWEALVDGITRREAPCDTPDDVFDLLDGITDALRLMHERST